MAQLKLAATDASTLLADEAPSVEIFCVGGKAVAEPPHSKGSCTRRFCAMSDFGAAIEMNAAGKMREISAEAWWRTLRGLHQLELG
jgi:hypothetical protein